MITSSLTHNKFWLFNRNYSVFVSIFITSDIQSGFQYLERGQPEKYANPKVIKQRNIIQIAILVIMTFAALPY